MRMYLRAFRLKLLSLVGNLPSHRLRRLLYRPLGFTFPGDSVVYGGAEIRHPKNIDIGAGTIIGNGAILDGRLGIRIGRRVNISTGVWIWTVQHDFRSPSFADEGGEVVIGDYAWLSCRSVILPGVIVGEGAVVAAGAVVTKNVAPYTVVGGVPAKQIGERPRGMSYKLGELGYTHFI